MKERISIKEDSPCDFDVLVPRGALAVEGTGIVGYVIGRGWRSNLTEP